jgi:arylsulfatase A-like enzyme
MDRNERDTGAVRPEQTIAAANPLTTGLVVGLGWGLVLGCLDGLSVLLELPILLHLWLRLQAFTYLVMWYGLAGLALFGLLGLIGWGTLHLLRHRMERRSLVAIYSGVSVGLAALLVGLNGLHVSLGHLSDAGHAMITLTLILLGSVIGLAVGLGTYGAATWWQGGRGTGPVRPVQGLLRPLRWNVVCAGVIAVFLVGIVVLLAAVIQQDYLDDLTLFRSGSFEQTATPEQPNILLITIDALRADHLGIYGYDPEISPYIDGLAMRGVVFDQAIVQAPWTGPSVASFVTSLHPTELGIARQDAPATDLRVDEMRVTLAEALQDAGYGTYAYITNAIVAPRNGHDQGFDEFSVTHSRLSFDLGALRERTLIALMCQKSGRGLYVRPVCRLFDQGYRQVFGLELTWGRGRPVTEYGKRFLRSHKDERFFLWLYYVDPHARYDPPQPFRPLPSEITSTQEQTLRSLAQRNDFYGEVMSAADLEALISLYDGEILYVDSLVGQVLDELDRQGLADRTLIILNADHGEELDDHGDFIHGHALYDELLRVPFIISGAGVEAVGRRVETQVRMLDLVPTVCEIAGALIPEEAQGRSLVPLLRGEEMDELPAFSEALISTAHEEKSVRRDGYKLIYDVKREIVELYDVRADPREQVNLAEEKPEIVERMLAELQAWMTQSTQRASELPRQRPLSQTMDEETRQHLRDVGY